MSELLSALGGGAIGIAVGEAGSTVLEPALEAPKQEAWKDSRAKILELNQLAELVATTLNVLADVQDDAYRNGYDDDALASAVQLALKAPGAPEAEALYLRGAGNYPGAINLQQLHHAYGKAGLEGQWWAPRLAAAENQLLTPAQLALSIVRSTVQSSGLLVVDLDTSDSNVQQYPVAALDPIAEAAAFGINPERLRVLVGDVGLPMSAEQAARAQFRSILTMGAYNQAVLESDTRPEWGPFIYEFARQIPTAEQYLENYLRGYTTDFQTALENAAKHGMSTSDATTVFQNMGRPMSVHEITMGLAHGASFNPIPGEITDPYEASVHEANLKPSYYDLAIAARQYTWPPYFILKDIVPDPISVEDATSYLEYQGYRPDIAAAIANSFGKSSTAAPSSVKSATTSALTVIRNGYVQGTLTPAQATTHLAALGEPTATIQTLLGVWAVQAAATADIAAAKAAAAAPPEVAPPGGG